MKLKKLVFGMSSFVTLAIAPYCGIADQIEMVYTMSNATNGNKVLAFNRQPDGKLVSAGAFATGGVGTGGSLGNQSAVVLDPSDRWLLVANAGDGTISSFRVLEDKLELVDRKSSGGFSPVSLTVFGTLVYVVNEGDPEDPRTVDNISGFRLNGDGTLKPIPRSKQPLSGEATDPAQISFNSEGTVLLVTEKATNTITTYTLNSDDTPSAPISRSSAVPTPFGFEFGDRDVVYISEANTGGPGVVASYRVNRDTGEVSSAIDVLDTENATCWAVLSNDQTLGYATNTGSASVSLFKVNFDGTMEPLSEQPTITTGEGPLDLVLTQDGQYLYTLDSGDDTISAFRVGNNGQLSPLNTVSVPDGANGLAAR